MSHTIELESFVAEHLAVPRDFVISDDAVTISLEDVHGTVVGISISDELEMAEFSRLLSGRSIYWNGTVCEDGIFHGISIKSFNVNRLF